MAYTDQLVETSKLDLDDELGPYKDFMPIVQLLATEVEYIRENNEPLLESFEYERLARAYYSHELTRIFVRTRKSTANQVDGLSWLITRDSRFSASITDRDTGGPQINISVGLIHSLTDLALRAACSENFCNPLPGDPMFEFRWRGGKTRELHTNVKPLSRFRDYSPAYIGYGSTIPEALTAEQLNLQNVGVTPFVSRIPVDPNRLQLAQNLIRIALTWVFLHEEAHAVLNHLEEVSSGSVNSERPEQMEQEADAYASERTFSTYIEDDTAFECLGIGLKGDLRWRINLVSSAIALAMTGIVTNETVTFGGENHPPAEVRLLRAALSVMGVFSGDALTYRGNSSHDFSNTHPVRQTSDIFALNAYDYIGNMVWDFITVDELLRDQFGIKNFSGQDRIFKDDYSAILIATALARRAEGRLSPKGKISQLVSFFARDDELETMFTELSKRYRVGVKDLKKDWRRVVSLVSTV